MTPGAGSCRRRPGEPEGARAGSRRVAARLDAALADARPSGGWRFLALPPNLGAGRAADLGERRRDLALGGRPATDENHYSKRVLLAGILTGPPIAAGLGPRRALAFVDRRIADVMAFEKWKATDSVPTVRVAAEAARKMGERRFGRSVESPQS